MGNKSKTVGIGIIFSLTFIQGELYGENDGQDAVHLYQVGRAGNYCLSITRDESGCISGTNNNGDPTNILDFIRGRKVVFENLSDAPHDMKFSGTNADEIPPQAPQGPVVGKQMVNVDNNVAKITCSFHGDQLGVGYKVPEAKPIDQQGLPGHIDRSKAPGGAEADPARGGSAANDGPRPMVRTGLADVSDSVLKKSRPEDVARLIANRPELMGKLKEVRPLLAEELSSDENLRKVLAKNPNMGTSSGTVVSEKSNGTGFGGIDGTKQARFSRLPRPENSANTIGEVAGQKPTFRIGKDSRTVATDFGTVTTYNLSERNICPVGHSCEGIQAPSHKRTGTEKIRGGTTAESVDSLRNLASLRSKEGWAIRGIGSSSTVKLAVAVPTIFLGLWLLFKRKKRDVKS